jgi:light-regulated signal transduction histidine kinase (bacteriophytochrome)
MSDARRELEQRYTSALATYVLHPDEDGLSVAYELGRSAMQQGFGVLDMAAVHRDAIASLVVGAEAAADFLRELLSPFEMMFRGYAEANVELRRVNDALLREREAVLNANRELEAFSYSVSHDLRAPLRAITTFAAILDAPDTGILNAEQSDCVSRIRDNGRHMASLIDDLLALSKVARAAVKRTNVDLTALAHEVLAHLKNADPDRHVDINVQDALVADADAGLMRVVVENLLGNAWKYTSKRSEAQIEIGVLARDHSVYFVRDDGAGFDMAYLGKLFGPFQRLHPTREFEGTGIGLATVQRIIRRHGGRIWAESEPDHGATFFFTLGEQRAA